MILENIYNEKTDTNTHRDCNISINSKCNLVQTSVNLHMLRVWQVLRRRRRGAVEQGCMNTAKHAGD